MTNPPSDVSSSASETPAPESTPPPANRWAYAPIAVSLVVGCFALDQWTKWLTIKYLMPESPWPPYPVQVLIPNHLQLIYAENRGAAFSILYGHVELLAIITALAIGFLVWFFQKMPENEVVGRIACGFILGGALGNLYDRVFRGFVVDMIDAYVGEHHWPTFNIADSCICIGMALLMIRIFQGKI